MTTSVLTTNIVGDLEIQNNSALTFEMPVKITGSLETLIDEFDAKIYLGARITVTIRNELNQIEINELMVVHDDSSAFIKNISVLNNLTGNNYISNFRAELLRGFVRVFVTGAGNRNEIRFFKLMFKR